MTEKMNVRMHLVLLAAFIAGCAGPGALLGETTGEKIRKVLAHIDEQCRQRKIGPYLDRSDPEYQQKARLGNCDILKVKPFDLYAVLATPEGKFAYSIQLPAPLDKPRVNRKDYPNAESYFGALCEKEAGEYIFAQPPSMKEVTFLKTPQRTTHQTLGASSEEATGGIGGSEPELLLLRKSDLAVVYRLPRSDEINATAEAKSWRAYRRDSNRAPTFPTFGLTYESVDAPLGQYGVLWRGTDALNDRESGIFGSDLIVIERQSNAVVAVRRTLTKDRVDDRMKDQLIVISAPCPGTVVTDGLEFLAKVAQFTTGMRK